MSGALPPVLDLAQAARQGARLQGQLPIASMPRLRAALASGDGEATLDLRVQKEPGGRVTITGRVDAELEVICQRCLEAMQLQVHAEPRLAWVKSEDEAAALSEEYEPLLLPDGRLTTAELATEELLLALPLAPMHAEQARCGKLAQAAELQVVTPPEEARRSPFEQLAALKRGR